MSQGYRMTAVNESCRRLLVEEGLWKERMAVSADVYLCNAMNAFAQPAGNVFLGQPLMNRIYEQKGQAFTFQAGGFIMAHEYSHEFQFRILANRGQQITNGPNLELQADLLGGYWVGMRLKEQEQGLHDSGLYGEISAIKSIARKMAYDLGDFAFNSPQHHGTPNQRFNAVSLGLTAGFESRFGSPDEAFRDRATEIYDWSAQKVSVIRSNNARPTSGQSESQDRQRGLPQYCCTPAGKLGPYRNDSVPEGEACYGTANGMRYEGIACY